MFSILKKLSIAALSLFLLSGWSIKEAHDLGNDVMVRVGDYCSGTVIDKTQGLILTAAHCTQRMTTSVLTIKETGEWTYTKVYILALVPEELTIDSFTDEGYLFRRALFTVVLVGKDTERDVAILRIISDNRPLQQAKLSKALPKFGDKIYAVGNPLMLPGVVSQGYVIQPRVLIEAITTETELILFDAQMDAGSSGGGLYNDSGELIGVTNWRSSGGEFLASPIRNVFYLLAFLKLEIVE